MTCFRHSQIDARYEKTFTRLYARPSMTNDRADQNLCQGIFVGVTAFCVPTCYLFARKLGTSALCSPPPHPIKQFSANAVPFKPNDFRIKQNKGKYLNKGKLSRHNDKLSLRRDNFFILSFMTWQQNLLFVSFILHHCEKGKLNFTRIRAF